MEAEAVATQTPPDLAGMLSLAVVAVATARRVEVEVKPGWREPLNLYVVVALSSGSRKSAVFRDLIAPIEAEEERAALTAVNHVAMALEEERSLDRKLKKARQDHDGGNGVFENVQDAASELAGFHVPAMPRLLADDITSEKLEILLEEQEGRMAVFAAEGDVFDILMGRYSASGVTNLGVFLKAHAGDSIRVDRVNRERVSVHNPALTIGLAVQPDVINGLSARREFRGRGLTARFLYSIPKNNVGRRDVDPPPLTRSVRTTYEANITRLLELRPSPEGAHRPHVLPLDDEALSTLLQFAERIEPELAPAGELGGIADWGGKAAGAFVRIAANLHLADHADNDEPWTIPITRDVMERAIEIGWYLIPHAQTAFALMGADPAVADANHILHWIIGKQKTEFSKRDLFEGVKGRFKKVQNMKSGLALLEDHEYIRSRKPVPRRPQPGRPPSPVFDVNPALFSQYSHKSQN